MELLFLSRLLIAESESVQVPDLKILLESEAETKPKSEEKNNIK